MEKHFSTIDFYAAAALIAENYELVDYYRHGGFTTFLFNDSPELHDFIKCYFAEKALIEPIKFGRSIKNLKSLIHCISTSTSNGAQNNGFNNNTGAKL
jgi:hypothetical protein